MLILLATACSCTRTSGEPRYHRHDDTTLTKDSSAAPDWGIVLVNNEKWKVDEAMMVHIAHMDQAVQNYSASGDIHHQALADTLHHHLGLLTSNCTMTGQAHDELHKWLIPFITETDRLAAITDTSAAARQVQLIRDYFTGFHRYFH